MAVKLEKAAKNRIKKAKHKVRKFLERKQEKFLTASQTLQEK